MRSFSRLCASVGVATLAMSAPAIVAGVQDGTYESVGLLGYVLDFEGVEIPMHSGSGTVIASNMVLTAKHVNADFMQLGDEFHVPVARYDHPTADLALLEFEEGAFDSWTEPFFGDMVGQEVTMVGYGLIGIEREDGTGYDLNLFDLIGGRWRGKNVVAKREMISLEPDVEAPESWSLMYDFDGNGVDTYGDGGRIPGEAHLLSGDSGGGWFIDVNGQPRLVAVSSFIEDGTGNGRGPESEDDFDYVNTYLDYGDLGGGVDLYTYQGWLQSHLDPVPEPASVTALAAGFLVLLRRRRRRS